MANTNLVELFTGIADSIRAKDGTTETIAPIDFASRIEALSVGSNEDSGPITDSPASMNIITFTTEIPSSQTTTDTFPVPEEHKTTLTSVSQLISVEGYWYDDDSYHTYSYIPQRVLQFKTSKRLERCPNGVWDTNINASTSLTLSSDGVIGTSDRTGWEKGYPIKVTYMVTK